MISRSRSTGESYHPLSGSMVPRTIRRARSSIFSHRVISPSRATHRLARVSYDTTAIINERHHTLAHGGGGRVVSLLGRLLRSPVYHAHARAGPAAAHHGPHPAAIESAERMLDAFIIIYRNAVRGCHMAYPAPLKLSFFFDCAFAWPPILAIALLRRGLTFAAAAWRTAGLARQHPHETIRPSRRRLARTMTVRPQSQAHFQSACPPRVCVLLLSSRPAY